MRTHLGLEAKHEPEKAHGARAVVGLLGLDGPQPAKEPLVRRLPRFGSRGSGGAGIAEPVPRELPARGEAGEHAAVAVPSKKKRKIIIWDGRTCVQEGYTRG